MAGSLFGQAFSQYRIRWYRGDGVIENHGINPEPSSANEDGDAPARLDFADCALGQRFKLGDAELFFGIGDIKKMVPNSFHFAPRDFASANIEASVHLTRIGRDNFAT